MATATFDGFAKLPASVSELNWKAGIGADERKIIVLHFDRVPYIDQNTGNVAYNYTCAAEDCRRAVFEGDRESRFYALRPSLAIYKRLRPEQQPQIWFRANV